MSNKLISVVEAGRRGIMASIEKYGKRGHSERCRMAVAARMFYARHDGDIDEARAAWSGMSENAREEWYHKNRPRKSRKKRKSA